MQNKKIAELLLEIATLLDIQGVAFKPAAYRRASQSVETLEMSIADIYKESGLKGIKKIKGVGQSIAQKIEEYLKKKKIKYLEELREDSAIRQVVTHYFETKGVPLDELKRSARRRKIIYSRFTKPAKQLIELAGSVEKAKAATSKVAEWAKTRKLDYSIETVFKKWLELDNLKPKEAVKKAFYKNKPMVWSEQKKKWFVVPADGGEWLEFAGDKKDMEWRIVE